MAAQRARSALWVLPYPRSVVVPRAMSASLVWAWHLLSVRGMSLGQLGTAQTFTAAMSSPRSCCGRYPVGLAHITFQAGELRVGH